MLSSRQCNFEALPAAEELNKALKVLSLASNYTIITHFSSCLWMSTMTRNENKILIIQPKMFLFLNCVIPVRNSDHFFFDKNLICDNLARALVRVKLSSSPIKLSFRFWSLAGERFKCRQKHFNTVIYEGCSSSCCYFMSKLDVPIGFL